MAILSPPSYPHSKMFHTTRYPALPRLLDPFKQFRNKIDRVIIGSISNSDVVSSVFIRKRCAQSQKVA